MSKKSELTGKIVDTPVYLSLLKRMSEDERKKSDEFIAGLVDAFVPAIEAFERMSSDPELCQQFIDALRDRSTASSEEKKDPESNKGST